MTKKVIASHPLCKDGYYKICDHWDSANVTRTKLDEEELENSKIVLCVGDSFTFGDGMYYTDTWPALLQDTPMFKDYKVINVGLRGASNDLITKLIRDWCNRYSKQIEYVIVGYSFMDRRLHHCHPDVQGQYFTSMMNLTIGAHGDEGNYSSLMHNAYMKMNTDLGDLDNNDRNILLTKGLGKIHNFKTYFFHMALCSGYRDQTAATNFDEFCDHDFVFMDIDTKEFQDPRMAISKEDGHWSVHGHQVVASIIEKHIDPTS